MKRYHIIIIILSFFLVSCATVPPDRYNTQKGAAIGAGAGALLGQAIGSNTQSTLIGMAAGTIIGALVGNAVDQDYQAARDAALYGKPVIYYDKNGWAVEAVPEKTNDPNCQKVRKRIWENGELVKETVEEVCGLPAPVVRYYTGPPPPPTYSYGWPLGLPSISFYYGKPRHHGSFRYHAHPHHRGRRYR